MTSYEEERKAKKAAAMREGFEKAVATVASVGLGLSEEKAFDEPKFAVWARWEVVAKSAGGTDRFTVELVDQGGRYLGDDAKPRLKLEDHGRSYGEWSGKAKFVGVENAAKVKEEVEAFFARCVARLAKENRKKAEKRAAKAFAETDLAGKEVEVLGDEVTVGVEKGRVRFDVDAKGNPSGFKVELYGLSKAEVLALIETLGPKPAKAPEAAGGSR